MMIMKKHWLQLMLVVGFLVEGCLSEGGVRSNKRVALSPFAIALRPIQEDLDGEEKHKILKVVEYMLEDFLMSYQWSSKETQVIDVTVNASKGEIVGVQDHMDDDTLEVAMGGYVYFGAFSDSLPDSDFLNTLIVEALDNTEKLTSELKQQFPALEEAALVLPKDRNSSDKNVTNNSTQTMTNAKTEPSGRDKVTGVFKSSSSVFFLCIFLGIFVLLLLRLGIKRCLTNKKKKKDSVKSQDSKKKRSTSSKRKKMLSKTATKSARTQITAKDNGTTSVVGDKEKKESQPPRNTSKSSISVTPENAFENMQAFISSAIKKKDNPNDDVQVKYTMGADEDEPKHFDASTISTRPGDSSRLGLSSFAEETRHDDSTLSTPTGMLTDGRSLYKHNNSKKRIAGRWSPRYDKRPRGSSMKGHPTKRRNQMEIVDLDVVRENDESSSEGSSESDTSGESSNENTDFDETTLMAETTSASTTVDEETGLTTTTILEQSLNDEESSTDTGLENGTSFETLSTVGDKSTISAMVRKLFVLD